VARKHAKEKDQLINGLLTLSLATKGRNLQMPGDGRYQPKDLKPWLGYDQWAGWLVIVEWCWLLTLAKIGVMPKAHAKLLTTERFIRLIQRITTTKQDAVEAKTRHDILALLELMRAVLPKTLHRWLHFGATSYDIISTAYALQANCTFTQAFWPKLCDLDEIWREKISDNAKVVQAGRTHLQTALPVTVGFWLANLHHRFLVSSLKALVLCQEIPGKFTGAVGTSSAQRALFKQKNAEAVLMEILGLPAAKISTQITPPEGMARFYFELVLLSGSLANLGEDVRILQASEFGEIMSASSSSSTMAHKKGNPISAENVSGMHTTVQAEFHKIMANLVSDLQRDLRGSSPMRSYSAVMVYVFKQVETAIRLLKSLKVDRRCCQKNFGEAKYLVMAELLHLALQREGCPDTHSLINQTVVPKAVSHGTNLAAAMDLAFRGEAEFVRYWKSVPEHIKQLLVHPEQYIGDAVLIAEREAQNGLSREMC